MNSNTLETIEMPPRLNYAHAAPAALGAMLALQQAVNRGGLERRLLELVRMRASQINGCAFCLDMHVREARAAGETDDRLFLLDAWSETSLYTARERAALHWTEVLTRLAGNHVTDDDFAIARAEFSEEELAQLSFVIVAINGWNRLNVGFRIPPGATA